MSSSQLPFSLYPLSLLQKEAGTGKGRGEAGGGVGRAVAGASRQSGVGGGERAPRPLHHGGAPCTAPAGGGRGTGEGQGGEGRRQRRRRRGQRRPTSDQSTDRSASFSPLPSPLVAVGPKEGDEDLAPQVGIGGAQPRRRRCLPDRRDDAAYSAASLYPPLLFPSDQSLSLVPHLFARLLHHHSPALLVDAATAATVSCADLRRLVSSLAAGLRHRLHIARGSLVLLLLPNSVTFPVAFLAVLATGAVATTMNPSSAPDEIAARLRDTAPSLVLASTDNAAKLPPLAAPLVLVPDTFQQLEDDDQFDFFFHALLDPETPAPAVDVGVGVGQDDAAAVLYSSGTSGRSKGVVLTHRNLIAMVELFVRFEASQYTRPACDNVYLAALPMFHVYGLSLFAVGLLSLGCTVVVMRRFHVGDAVRTIRRYKVTHLPVVPPIMSALLRAKPKPPLESLLQVSSGAAPLNANLIHDFLHTFPHVDFIQGYGMTESTAVGTRGFNTCKHKKYASVGLLAPNMHAKIVHLESGSCLPPGSCGELWLHGPAIMKGYLNDDDDAFTRKDGWLRTGDIAYFDSDGYLFIVGRLKDTIKYKGFQIAPADLEAVLIRHPEIVDVAVTSDEDEEAGEIPVAFVVRKSGSTLSCTHVMEYLAKQVASYKRVRKVIFVEAIPKSAAGKVLRRLLKDSLVDASSGRSRL